LLDSSETIQGQFPLFHNVPVFLVIFHGLLCQMPLR